MDQKTFVEVNEEGTEAAAATAVGMGIISVPQMVEMRVDRFAQPASGTRN